MIYAKTKIFYSLNKCLEKKVEKVLYMSQELLAIERYNINIFAYNL